MKSKLFLFSFKNILPATDDDDDDVLFTRKIKTKEEKVTIYHNFYSSMKLIFQKKEDEDYIEWLKGQKSELSDSSIKSDLVFI